MVGVGLYIRLGILETPTFSRLLAENRIEPAPVLEVIKRQPKSIILVALARMGEMAPAYARTRSFELSIMPGRPNIECWKLAGQPGLFTQAGQEQLKQSYKKLIELTQKVRAQAAAVLWLSRITN
jgi:hypothetical protein